MIFGHRFLGRIFGVNMFCRGWTLISSIFSKSLLCIRSETLVSVIYNRISYKYTALKRSDHTLRENLIWVFNTGKQVIALLKYLIVSSVYIVKFSTSVLPCLLYTSGRKSNHTYIWDIVYHDYTLNRDG